jgi:thiol:disulfide interchange protein
MARTDQRAIPVGLIVIAAALVIARFAWVAPSAKDSLVRWLPPSEGLARAQMVRKPILYDFTAEWCHPCRSMDEAVFSDPQMASRINERFIAVRVTDRQREEGRNPAEVADLQRRYGVRGYPTIVFADPGGIELGRMEGFRGREEFERLMESLR